MQSQPILVGTRHHRSFSIRLDRCDAGEFHGHVAVVDVARGREHDLRFDHYSDRATAEAVFREVLDTLCVELTFLDASDAIATVDNPTHTQFITVAQEQSILGPNSSISVRGVNSQT